MTTDENENHETHEAHGGQGGGGWQPIPQGEYDGDATAFVQLPPGVALDGIPLEAPGHGYVPPPIGDPHATAQWNFQEALAAEQPAQPAPPAQSAPPAAGAASDLTGQWTIPVAQGDLPEESGEYHVTSPHQPAGAPAWSTGSAPSTLPGGALAPWATTPEPTPQDEPPTAAPTAVPAAVPDGPPEDETTPGAPAYPAAPAAPASAGAFATPDGEATSEGGVAYAGAPGSTGDSATHGGSPAPAAPASAASAPAGDPATADSSAAPGGPDPEGVPAPATPDGAGAPAPDAPAADPAPDAPTAPAADAPSQGGDPTPAGPTTAPEADANAPDPAADAPAPTGAPRDEHSHASYVLRVNGADRPVTEAWIGESLLYVLRERLGLAGAKDGCSQGECGACNVQVDGRLVASCLVPAATAAGSEVRTVEGLAVHGEPSDVQRALARCGAVQCGFCIPGMAMTMHDLLEGNHAPTDREARQALSGNLCRCTGYHGALRAVREVIDERRAAATHRAPAPDADHAPEERQQHPEVRIPHQVPHPHDGGTA